MSDILQALLDTEDSPEKDVFMSRFGVAFRIRAIDGKAINRIRTQATKLTKKGEKQLDEERFGSLLIAQASVNIDWNNKELKAKYGAVDSADVIEKRLLAGEIVKLMGEIMELSGFGDEAEAVDEIKN